MKKKTLLTGTLLMALLSTGSVHAQLSTNPDKFLGNITTRGQVNGGGLEFKTLWNQLTPENETKWSSVQGGGPNSWNWGGAQNAYNYCKQNNLLFKFHCLAWGSQYPGWIESLTPQERYKAIVKWMDECKKKFPDLKVIDVVNEAVDGHQKGTYLFEEALGGRGVTGWDWIINAFKLAHERWPDAILIYNDFNTFQWQRSQFIQLVKTLRDNGAPIDAYGCQSHDCTGYSLNSFRQAVDEIQNNLKMPMYSTEYDIGTGDDNQQLTNYKEQIPYMWEKDYFAGLTLWGYIYGATWTTDGNSGIIRNGNDRPAMKWLREYMKSDKAKTAKSPFPGMKKEADLYICPPVMGVEVGTESLIPIDAKLRTKKIERIDFYANNQLVESLIEAPYTAHYTPGKQGNIELKAVMVATDGTEYVRYGGVKVVEGRKPYKTTLPSIPGLLQAENFDVGLEGNAYHDNDYTNTGNKTNYRTNGGGVDMSTGSSSSKVVVSQTEDGEWMEYTVNVRETGSYSIEVTASSGVDGAAISLALQQDGKLVPISGTIEIPCTKPNAWNVYKTFYYRLPVELPEGRQVLRLQIEKGGSYIDQIQFRKVVVNPDMSASIKVSPEEAFVTDSVHVDITPNAGDELKKVDLYINNVKVKTYSEPPYEYDMQFTESGEYSFMTFLTDTLDRVSEMATVCMKVDKKRIPHKGVIEIPGTFEAEDFDQMGEGYSFHDTDNVDQGAAKYRSDNEGVDIQKGNGGYVIGYIADGEWLDYSIDVKQTGIYNYEVIASTENATAQGKFRFYLVDANGKETAISSTKTFRVKGDWNSYDAVTGVTSLTLPIPAGRQILRVKFTSPFNMDKLTFTLNEEETQKWMETGVTEIEAHRIDTYIVYTTDGAQAGTITASAADDLSSKVYRLTGKSGAYVIKNQATGEAKTLIVK